MNLIDRSNKKEDIYFEINEELREFNDDIFQSKSRTRGASESNIDRKTDSDQQQKQKQKRPRRYDRRVSKKP